MKHSIGDLLFLGCLIFLGGGITSLLIGKIGCFVLAGIMVTIILSDNSDKEKM